MEENVLDFKSPVIEEPVKKEMNEFEKLEQQAKEDPVLKKALQTIKANDSVCEELVTEFMSQLQERIQNPDHPFNIKHAFATLSRCLVYCSQMMCADFEHFQSEIRSANDIVINNFMPSIPNDNIDNFSFKRLMLLASTLIDNVFWREALGETVTEEEAKAMKVSESKFEDSVSAEVDQVIQ